MSKQKGMFALLSAKFHWLLFFQTKPRHRPAIECVPKCEIIPSPGLLRDMSKAGGLSEFVLYFQHSSWLTFIQSKRKLLLQTDMACESLFLLPKNRFLERNYYYTLSLRVKGIQISFLACKRSWENKLLTEATS